MTAHAPILPILIPFAAALVLMAGTGRGLAFQRGIGLAAALAGIGAAAWLTLLADRGEVLVYALGNWPAPFGIVLAADRLAAGMTLLTALLAAVCLLHASHGFDARGRHFHAFFQLQIVGLQGAFLTGDLFNLFVFFEVMLLASYALLAHGGGLARSRAGLAYVVLNLAGSALFLIALGLLYGMLGTLNLADVALRLQGLEHDFAPARLAAALLIAVFALKAALLPLSFWLPMSYAAAGAPVAALFALLTKVGIVAILRVQVVAFAPAPATAGLLDWLTPLALLTILFAAFGALAAGRLRALAAWLVLGSAGVLLAVPAHAGAGLTAAALFYLVQSTFAGAAFFLLAERIGEQRGEAADRFCAGPPLAAPWLALGFFLAAATAAGLPPFSGFLGKLMLLEAFRATPAAAAVWGVLLTAGFLLMITLARNGSRLFWERHSAPVGPPQGGAANDMERAQPANTHHPLPREGGREDGTPPAAGWRRTTALVLLVAAGPLLALFARPLADYAARAAAQLHAPEAYIAAVLGPQAKSIERQRRP